MSASPQFDDRGLLPAGVHTVSVGQASFLLCGNRTRRDLWADFCALLRDSAELHPIFTRIVIDSAFVTQHECPSHITVALFHYEPKPGERPKRDLLISTLRGFREKYPRIHVKPHPAPEPFDDWNKAYSVLTMQDLEDGMFAFPTARKGLLAIDLTP